MSTSPIETQVSVMTRSAPATASRGSWISFTYSPAWRISSIRSFSGLYSSGVAMVKWHWNSSAALTQECSTLLLSPTQATLAPLMLPRCSSKVIKSAMIWQGWARRVSPRSEEHTSELQSRPHLVCRLLLEKKKNTEFSFQLFLNSTSLYDHLLYISNCLVFSDV